MVKIKQKKQLNSPQLIEWAWDNDIRDTMIKLKSEYPAKQGIVIDNGGRLHLVGMDYLSKSNTFTIEVEEEITEDTHLDYLYALTNDDEKEIHRCMNFTIRNASMVIGRNDLTFFTLVGNDLVKIYENGKLAE